MTRTRKPEISPRYLSEDERVTIAGPGRRVPWCGRGSTVRAIAAELGRSPTTVSAVRQAAEPGADQCVLLRLEFPDEPERQVVHETICQAIYRPELGGLRRELPKVVLRTGRRRRMPHRHPAARAGWWT